MTSDIFGFASRMAWKVSRIRTRAATSMALIGSSARMTPGSSTMARAMATRCACPPDRSMGYRAANTAGSSPTSRNARPIRAAASSSPMPLWCNRNGSSTERATRQRGSSEAKGSWNTSPVSPRSIWRTASFRSPIAWPRYAISPQSADSRPNSTRVNVDLPEPEAPMIARHSPLRTSMSTSNSTCLRFRFDP